MSKKIFKLFFLCLLVLLSVSCKKDVLSQKDQPGAAAVHYYKLFQEGEFDQWIAAKISCDSTSESYRNNLKTLFRQSLADYRERYGAVSRIECHRVEETHNGGVQVYLKVKFGKGSSEMIAQPLVWNGKKWRLQ